MPRRDDITSVLVLGSGPIVIGQACEFDYSGTQACKVLRDEGLRVVLVNSNPATIMTDPAFADATYVEPLTVEAVTAILDKEDVDAILPTLGGQTALNLAVDLHEAGVLERFGVEVLTGLRLTALVDHVGVRARSAWTPNSGRPDGDPYTLLHLSAATDAMAGGRLRVDLGVRNALDTRYEHLVYLDDADRTTTNLAGDAVPRFPRDIEAEGRTLTVGVEVLY